MAVSLRQFPTPTAVSVVGAVRKYALSATGVATASNTKTTVAALGAARVSQMAPEATVTAASAVPAAGTAWNQVGWEMNAQIDSLGDGGVTRAGTVPVILSWTSSTAGSITFTVILYIEDVEIGRGTLTANTTTAAAPYTVNVAVNAGVSFPANTSMIQMAVYASLPGNLGVGTVTYTLNYGTSTTTGTNVAPVTYSIQAARTGSDSTTTTESASRAAYSTTRTASDGDPIAADTAARRIATVRRAVDEQAVQTDSASRSATYRPVASDTSTTTDTASRFSASFRRSADSVIPFVDTAFRAITKSITATHTEQVALAVEAHTVTYGRTAAHYFVPTDPPLLNPVKRIAGVIRLQQGGQPYLGGAVVQLIRDSDNLVVQQTTSSTTDGGYFFLRNSYDTETYHVAAFANVSGVGPEQDITKKGLVPV